MNTETTRSTAETETIHRAGLTENPNLESENNSTGNQTQINAFGTTAVVAMTTVTVKVCIAVPGPSPAEVRRFKVDADLAASLGRLTGKIKEICPRLEDSSNIQLYWKGKHRDRRSIPNVGIPVSGRLISVSRLNVRSQQT